MTLTEFIVVLAIALYAMVGGAFINAAITTPVRCLQVLNWMWPEVISTFLLTGAGFIAAGAGMAAMNFEIGIGIFAVGSAHLSLFILFLYARRIARAALAPDEQEGQR
ncbi:hypothetical protein [Gemmobacter caeni]|uniref:hypothetical protein n=1 Tax=Gemmobacter caeni TaxID=589035 RepID=UPI0011A7001F|nr:hypothetical protein [Gemmobacter caeni]